MSLPTSAPTPSSALGLAILLSLVSLGPALILTCTTFARFIVVFSLVKSGMGTPGAPPNQVLVGLALFMTIFVMAPWGNKIYDNALGPYMAGKMDERTALAAATPTMLEFLVPRTRQADLQLFYEMSDAPRPASLHDVPLRIAIPAFVLSELRTGLEMGLIMLLPFLVIDLVVAIVLSSLGMVMMPPAVVALPLKLLLFIAVDGWHLVVRALMKGVM